MADCEVLEKDCSHFIPGLFGSLISTVLIALSLFAFDGRMALAALWVIPVSAAIVMGSYRVQDKVQARTMAAKMACADGIQEYIETLRDLKASNAEQRYLSGLSGKIRAVEKQSIVAELETALFVSSAGMVLKLGIASVALTGSVLLAQGRIDVLTLFLFLMAASRMYDPMQGALQNLAAVIAMRTNVGRMNEILDASLQTGSEQLTNQGCDIVFDHVALPTTPVKRCCGMSLLPQSRGRSRHWWAPPAAARPLFPDWRHGSGTTRRAASPWAAWRFPESTRKSS